MAGDQTFSSGEYIFREGESAVYGYIVKSGVVEIVKHGSGGDQVLAELEPPTIFGEMALIDGNPRSAGATGEGRHCSNRSHGRKFCELSKTKSGSRYSDYEDDIRKFKDGEPTCSKI